ncbi:hypothetical protein QYF61_009853 [Mycteria americana]|uniref:Keratin n=1 Tax=Mycteria americana TaxID=33587 RepID=A0AAN7RMD6_MYCAM|nr:hypothetical protein QYF61_009853 [Mycteria americana]
MKGRYKSQLKCLLSHPLLCLLLLWNQLSLKPLLLYFQTSRALLLVLCERETRLFLTYLHALLPPCPLSQVHLQRRDMSCYDQCLPCQPCGPTPLANSCNEPCVRQCHNSTVVIQPSPMVVTLPGPILSSFPQNTVVGSSTSAAVGSILSCDGVPITSGCCDLPGISSRYYGRRCLLC